jgi:hypothetical protein
MHFLIPALFMNIYSLKKFNNIKSKNELKIISILLLISGNLVSSIFLVISNSFFMEIKKTSKILSLNWKNTILKIINYFHLIIVCFFMLLNFLNFVLDFNSDNLFAFLLNTILGITSFVVYSKVIDNRKLNYILKGSLIFFTLNILSASAILTIE